MSDSVRKAAPVSASEWDYCTIKELSAALESRQISASELLERTVARLEASMRFARPLVRPTLHSPKGNGGPCSGSRSVKEEFNVAGLPTTWGFPEFKDFVPKEDALIISRTKRAGAVLLGKTNVPLGLGDFQSYNDIYGTTNNPWDIIAPRGLFRRFRCCFGSRLWVTVVRIGYQRVAARAGHACRPCAEHLR